MSKLELRKENMSRRMALSEEAWREKSQQLCELLLHWLKTQSYQRIALFRSFRREPDLGFFEENSQGYELFYPKTETDGRMDFFPHPGVFQKGRYGIEEPLGTGPALLPDSRTLILVPGIAYDRKGYRLGYGGGYYDRYFHMHPCSRLGICFSDFLFEDLPIEAHDQRVSLVLTERGIC